MAALTFMDLSVEIKTLIVKHIHRPTDLRNVALVCKQLHEIAVRELYYEVELDVGSPNDTRLAAFLSPKNIGLKHIKNLEIYLAEVPDKCNQHVQANFAVRMILELLPENILERFSWHPWSAFSGGNLILLYKKQKRMKWLEAIALDRDVIDEIQKIPNFADVFQNVTKLGLYPDSRQVLNYCQLLVKKATKLENLTIHASFDQNPTNSIPERELSDSSTGPGLITSTIFSHMRPFDKCVPIALKKINLNKVNLRYAADTFCKVIDFRSVTSIGIHSCAGADALLAALSRSTQLPNKLEKLEIKHYDNPEQDGLSALDGFLCLVSGIKELTIDMLYGKELPAAAGIVRHSKTLKTLNVHVHNRLEDGENELVFGYPAWSDICKSCSKLEQVSVAFPPVVVTALKHGLYTDFETCLTELHNLTTLHITTWPTHDPSFEKLPRKVYEHNLARLAQTTFVKHSKTLSGLDPPRSSKLAILAFGVSDKVYEREESPNQIIFVKGKQVDPLGVEKPVAVQIGWCLRKFVDAGPKSDILEYALSKSVGPPVQDDTDDEDSSIV